MTTDADTRDRDQGLVFNFLNHHVKFAKRWYFHDTYHTGSLRIHTFALRGHEDLCLHVHQDDGPEEEYVTFSYEYASLRFPRGQAEQLYKSCLNFCGRWREWRDKENQRSKEATTKLAEFLRESGNESNIGEFV